MIKWYGLFFLTIAFQTLFAQTTTVEPITLPSADTNRVIEIISANSMRQITLSGDLVLTTLAGQARVKQGNTYLSGDSIILNKQMGIAEIFGHVHINDADTVNTYSQYLRYMGNEQKAFLRDQVKLTDGKAILTTNEMEYDLKTGVATYRNGGKVINEKTTLTSTDAIYYSDTKDIFFKNQVHLRDPQYDMKADSLRYNTAFKTAYFIAPTDIQSPNGNITTSEGNYNLATKEALFLDRPVFRDSTRYMTGNKIAYDEKSNIIQVEGNGKLVDSTNKVMILGNQIFINKSNNSFIATRKPVMIFYKNNDSTFLAADTLLSVKKKNMESDTNDSAIVAQNKIDIQQNRTDSINYFFGYSNVKIYNDSVQAVADSMVYSSLDSTFRLFKKPACWNGNTQLTGDTMVLYTENQQAKSVRIYNNALVINKTKEGFFNQMGGKTINGFFKDGNIDYIRTKGAPAESIYYPQDEDSAYIGMNRSHGDLIDIYFENKNIQKIKFVNDVKGILYPIKNIPANKKELPNFEWRISSRPKTKLELFE